MQVMDTPILYGWQSYEERKEELDIGGLLSQTLTATIVTIIDTVLDISTTVTSGYTPSRTNSAGTRTEIVTYTKMGVAMSTILWVSGF